MYAVCAYVRMPHTVCMYASQCMRVCVAHRMACRGICHILYACMPGYSMHVCHSSTYYVYMYVCISGYDLYACMYACMNECMHECMHACVCVYNLKYANACMALHAASDICTLTHDSPGPGPGKCDNDCCTEYYWQIQWQLLVTGSRVLQNDKNCPNFKVGLDTGRSGSGTVFELMKRVGSGRERMLHSTGLVGNVIICG